jgi:hypothetical protein
MAGGVAQHWSRCKDLAERFGTPETIKLRLGDARHGPRSEVSGSVDAVKASGDGTNPPTAPSRLTPGVVPNVHFTLAIPSPAVVVEAGWTDPPPAWTWNTTTTPFTGAPSARVARTWTSVVDPGSPVSVVGETAVRAAAPGWVGRGVVGAATRGRSLPDPPTHATSNTTARERELARMDTTR